MALAAAGDWSKCFANAKTLLAAGSTFQTWVGHAGDATSAAEHIYEEELDADGDLSAKRPYALLLEFDPAEYERFMGSGGARNHFLTRGAVRVMFEEDIAADDVGDAATERRRFKNTLGQIIGDVELLAASGGYLMVRRIVLEHGPVRSDANEATTEGNYLQAAVRLEYGWEGGGA